MTRNTRRKALKPPRNPALAIALTRNGGPMRDRRARRAKERGRRELDQRFQERE